MQYHLYPQALMHCHASTPHCACLTVQWRHALERWQVVIALGHDGKQRQVHLQAQKLVGLRSGRGNSRVAYAEESLHMMPQLLNWGMQVDCRLLQFASNEHQAPNQL